MSSFRYSPLLPVEKDTTDYELVTTEHVSTYEMDGETFIKVAPEGLQLLAERAFKDISHLLRPAHLAQLRAILDDPEATKNDQFVALEMLKNAVVASDGVLPMCQDTGTALISATRGGHVLTDGDDAKHLSQGVYNTYQSANLRYSQLAPLTMFDEQNTKNNLPAQIDIYAGKGAEYNLTFIQKGGGSANKSFLYQKTKAVLNEDSMMEFVKDAIINLGTAACPPYHLAIVIGGTSTEYTMKTVKMASIKALDNLPTSGDETGLGWRDVEWEQRILQLTRELMCVLSACHVMVRLARLELGYLVLLTDRQRPRSPKMAFLLKRWKKTLPVSCQMWLMTRHKMMLLKSI